jgi:iron complex outermembrane recepter protein
MKGNVLLLVVLFFYRSTTAQVDSIPITKDSVKQQTLGEVIVTAFEQNRCIGASSINVVQLSAKAADRYNRSSVLSGLNSVPGVRMEERSPGSYRINLRGSSLRSPFGVRNVKVYWNGLPVTDPGGNTYFNQFAFNNFSTIEIFKGPAGSLYGAGTGGLVLMNSIDNNWERGVSAAYITGSFGLHNIFVTGKFGQDGNKNQLTYAHNQSDGFRDHTKMRRDNASWVSQLKISGKQQLTASVLYTDLYYETPGALTLAEFNKDPKASRPAAGITPSAVAAKAAIHQRNILAGLNNQQKIGAHFNNTTSIYGAFATIENPTVRNYEKRKEPHVGGRTSFSWQQQFSKTTVQLIAGTEIQQGFFNTRVSGNVNGKPDTLQTDDDIRYSVYTVFSQADVSINERLFINAGISLNSSKVRFTRLNELPVKNIERTYRNEYTPRLSVMGKITNDLSIGASFAKGFSPPSISELLPSTSVISTNLEAEQATNYELTVRHSFLRKALIFEANFFYFRLKNALVQRRDLTGADYYINAGKTRQKGIEFSGTYAKAFPGKAVSSILFKLAYTYNDFRYADLSKDTVNFSGKRLPSVPVHTIGLIADVNFKAGFYANITQYYASDIYLNDANSIKASGYNLTGARIGWKNEGTKFPVNLYAGAENIFNVTYSLGNDINDPRGRYFNTAAGRNYYIGVAIGWSRKM